MHTNINKHRHVDTYANLDIWNCHHRILRSKLFIFHNYMIEDSLFFSPLGNDFMTYKLRNLLGTHLWHVSPLGPFSVCPTTSVAGVVSFAAKLIFSSFSFVLFEAAFCDWMYKWMVAELWCQWYSVRFVEFFCFVFYSCIFIFEHV